MVFILTYKVRPLFVIVFCVLVHRTSPPHPVCLRFPYKDPLLQPLVLKDRRAKSGPNPATVCCSPAGWANLLQRMRLSESSTVFYSTWSLSRWFNAVLTTAYDWVFNHSLLSFLLELRNPKSILNLKKHQKRQVYFSSYMASHRSAYNLRTQLPICVWDITGLQH